MLMLVTYSQVLCKKLAQVSCTRNLHQIFSALSLLVRRQQRHPACKETEWWDAGVVICLGRGADLHMAHMMPLPLTISLQ